MYMPTPRAGRDRQSMQLCQKETVDYTAWATMLASGPEGRREEMSTRPGPCNSVLCGDRSESLIAACRKEIVMLESLDGREPELNAPRRSAAPYRL